jgi:hypothetical protein
MFGNNGEWYYQSSIGTIAVVPRPALSALSTDKRGQPQSVLLGNKRFNDIFGIQVRDYTNRQPALVVYQLADGTLLAATPEVIAVSGVAKTSQYHGQCYITQVSDLQLLSELPLDSNPIDSNLFDDFSQH